MFFAYDEVLLYVESTPGHGRGEKGYMNRGIGYMNRRSGLGVVVLAAVGGGFAAVEHAVVADYVGNAEVVVFEDILAAFDLGIAVQFQVPPMLDGRFVPPEGEG
jgi:hypothetical protein